MRPIFSSVATAIIAMTFTASLADAQPRRALQVTQANESQSMSCFVGAIQMTHDGLAFTCRELGPQTPTYHRVVFDGGSRPGGISAAMTLLTTYAADQGSDDYIILRVRTPSDRAQNICNAVDNGSMSCFEATSISVPIQ
ncbi:MAG: hypothetical protein GYB36_01310 [Alphaproteobacteria bacterium]|nr:hypothetical protein [Alphaproteobacteria bacterium]